MSQSNLSEQVAAFDRAVKRRIVEGEPPEEAVPGAATEVGLELGEERITAIVRVLKMAEVAARDPEFIRKRNALDAAIRQLVRGGMTIKRAVIQAQEDTGVKLSEQGVAILIQALEQESERLAGMAIEVVSDQEFRELQTNQRCMAMTAKGRAAWFCCNCAKEGHGTVNPADSASCRACGHGRCYEQ